jgi:excisionase family DNA binding protein
LETLCLEQAAQLLHISEDCLLRKARAGKVPGAKIGRRWVFVRADLIELIRTQAKERTQRAICHFTGKLRVPSGGSDSQSAESKLDAALKLLTGAQRTSLKPA